MNTSASSLRSLRLLQCSLRNTKSSGALVTSLGQLEQVVMSSSWSHARSLRSSRTPTVAQQRQRRPLAMNGEAIAFHVNDLSYDQQQLPRISFHPNSATSTTAATREYESDLIVILDMDECLIHSKFLSTPGAKFAHQLLQQQQQTTTTHLRDVESFRVTLPDGDLVHVNKRPFLDEFLQQVTSRYETHIFTAAMEIYAKPVLDTLDPTGTMFAKRWYRETCSYDATNDAYVKNLHRLLPTPDQHRRMVLVDNNPFSFLANPSNGILVSSFYNDPNDTTLLSVMALLEELRDQDDVRPMLTERFGLPEALQQIQNNHRQFKQSKTTGSFVTTSSSSWPPKPAATLLY